MKGGASGSPPLEVEAEIDRLYDLPLAQFTAARNALATRVRAAGEADRASAIRAFAKPNVSAWAVNALARHQRAELDALFAAGDDLRAAQAQTMAGGGSDALGVAMAAQRSALARLGLLAETVLEAAGHAAGAGTLDRIQATLRALSNDPASRAKLGTGRLSEDLEPPGFGALTDLASEAGAASPPSRAPAPPPAQASAGASAPARGPDRVVELAAERKRRAEAERRLAEKVAAVKSFREKLVEAERRVTETRRAADEALREAKEIRSELALAEEALEAERDGAAPAG